MQLVGTKYTLLPADAYKIANTTVTVPAGQRIASVMLSFIPAKVPATGGPFALPITIQTVPTNVTISANYKTQIVTVSLTKYRVFKNKPPESTKLIQGVFYTFEPDFL